MGYYYGAIYGELIIYIVIMAAIACVFGFATKKIIENKGYSENWFWWGFFFWLIAILVALSKPDINNRYNQYNTPSDKDSANDISSLANTNAVEVSKTPVRRGSVFLCPCCGAKNTPGNTAC